jgi:hypothetical protein
MSQVLNRNVAGSSPAAAQPRGDLTGWSESDAIAFGRRPLRAPHRIHDLEMFSEEALVKLLDEYPRERLQAFTMGTDPENRKDWQPVDTAGASGHALWEALKKGRLWFNVLAVSIVDPRYRTLIDRLYAELEARCPGFRVHRSSATLIISSPGALVYYHADAQPNLLWQLRGTKRVWVYPAGDPELVDQDLMEDIFASLADEEVPYRSDFDRKAEAFDLSPGQVLSWPQNAPHRVTNLDSVNVSLSTVYQTEESDRRALVWCANRLLRRQYGLPFRSTKETGPVSYAKRLAIRAARRLGLTHTPPRRAYLTTLKVDPASPTGFVQASTRPALTEYSRTSYELEFDAAGKPVLKVRTAAAK